MTCTVAKVRIGCTFNYTPRALSNYQLLLHFYEGGHSADYILLYIQNTEMF